MIKLNLIKPVLKESNLSELGHYPYTERIDYILKTLESRKAKDISEFINFPIYHANADEIWDCLEEFEGIYELNYIENFLGEIPDQNIREVKERYEVLEKNPFIEIITGDTLDYYGAGYRGDGLLVFAPLNNFASTSNISAIDPIIFVFVKIQDKNYLIPLTQWK